MQQPQVSEAADALLHEGLRPTIERVRQTIESGSPTTVSPMLELWFVKLARRLDGHGANPADEAHRSPWSSSRPQKCSGTLRAARPTRCRSRRPKRPGARSSCSARRSGLRLCRNGFCRSRPARSATKRIKAAPSNRSVLLLRRSISIHRSRVLIQGRFTEAGHRVLEVTYPDSDHAHEVLCGLPSFDACVIQSTFETIKIDMLSTLRGKTAAIAVDGAALSGLDVDAVGVEWGESLSAAVDVLRQRGHREIAFATTSHPFLANQLGLKRWAQICSAEPKLHLQTLAVPRLSHEDYQDALVELIRERKEEAGRLPFTAVVLGHRGWPELSGRAVEDWPRSAETAEASCFLSGQISTMSTATSSRPSASTSQIRLNTSTRQSMRVGRNRKDLMRWS
ncbi:DNA-binding protein [Variovorax davisae]|uniref:DNA-binding protein n=1 Tax=Variovorax davisae TaxID=3053515 RepID=UPI0040377EAE